MNKKNDFIADIYGENHRYMLNGREIPSVSQILKPVDDKYYSKIDSEVLEAAGHNGTAVHVMAQLEFANELDENNLDAGLVDYLHALRKWKEDDQNSTPINIEQSLFHKRLEYAGTPDLVYEDMIVDIKTRQVKHDRDAMQLIAYAKMLESQKIGLKNKRLYVLYLKKNGSYIFQRIQDQNSWGMFRTLLDYYYIQKKINMILEVIK